MIIVVNICIDYGSINIIKLKFELILFEKWYLIAFNS
jgi:hypothetical protein